MISAKEANNLYHKEVEDASNVVRLQAIMAEIESKIMDAIHAKCCRTSVLVDSNIAFTILCKLHESGYQAYLVSDYQNSVDPFDSRKPIIISWEDAE